MYYLSNNEKKEKSKCISMRAMRYSCRNRFKLVYLEVECKISSRMYRIKIKTV